MGILGSRGADAWHASRSSTLRGFARGDRGRALGIVVDVGRAQAMAVSATLAWSGAVLGGEAGSGAEARVQEPVRFDRLRFRPVLNRPKFKI